MMDIADTFVNVIAADECNDFSVERLTYIGTYAQMYFTHTVSFLHPSRDWISPRPA
jgi:hypothetical protein